jgi:hypothetical protein
MFPDILSLVDYESLLANPAKLRTMCGLCKACYLHYTEPLIQLTHPPQNVPSRLQTPLTGIHAIQEESLGDISAG